MKALYSEISGNPELTEEIGRNYEIGFSFQKKFILEGAIFYNQLTNLIRSLRTIYGYKTYDNVGQAVIKGGEIEIRRETKTMVMSLNYTYTDSVNEDTGQPLEFVPRSRLSFFLSSKIKNLLELNMWAELVSSSWAYLKEKAISIPAYKVINLSLEKRVKSWLIFFKVENLFNEEYFTEPGFPMGARTLRIGCRFFWQGGP